MSGLAQTRWFWISTACIIGLLMFANVQASNIFHAMTDKSAKDKAIEARITALEVQRKADHDQFEREHAVFLSKAKAMDNVCDRLSALMKVIHAR